MIRVHVAPANVTVEIGTPFSFQVHAAQLLHSLKPLSYALHMRPPSLQSDIDAFGRVTGLISVTDLPAVLSSGGALATVEVSNEFGSFLALTVALLIPPAPPIPLEDDYSYVVSENHSSVPAQVLLGVVSLVDPNGDPVQWGPTVWANETFALLPNLVPDGWVYQANLIAVTTQLNYERRSNYSLTLMVVDSADPSLVTTINISISVQPENEYSPHFIVARYVCGVLCTPHGLNRASYSLLQTHSHTSYIQTKYHHHFNTYASHIHTHVHTHTYIHTHMHTCTHAHMHTCPHVPTNTHTHTHTHTRTHTHTHTRTHTHIHTYTHAHMHTCPHAHMPACTH